MGADRGRDRGRRGDPAVLNLLAHAFGFAGAPNVGTVTSQPLAAPQATLISALAQGVIQQTLDWQMIGYGAALGVALVVLDEVLGRLKWLRLPPLAVGIGIYLPMGASLPVVLGAVIGHWYDGWTKKTADPEYSKRLAVLVASGMIVGESLWGVVLAGLISGTGNEAPFALVPAAFRRSTADRADRVRGADRAALWLDDAAGARAQAGDVITNTGCHPRPPLGLDPRGGKGDPGGWTVSVFTGTA